MKEYKIIKPDSVWSYKDKDFEDQFNKYASQGWEVKSVGFSQSGSVIKAILEREKNR